MTESDTTSEMPLTGTALMPALRLTAMIFLTIALSACNSEPQADAESAAIDFAAERETLMALERAWSNMYGQRDVDGIAELLAEESILLAPGLGPAVGRDSVVAATRALMAAEATDGTVVEGSYLVVWTKEDGEWKVAADIFN